MSPRLLDMTKWLYCLLAFYITPILKVESVIVRNPPQSVPGIEAQAKFFQDFFSVQLSPYKIEFGHVCEDPNNWEQRYEKKDFKNHRDMGKVRWGDKQGGYGEHYWDLNHAGHSDDHGHDDGDDHYGTDSGYHHHDSDDSYDEPSEHLPQYENEESPQYDKVPKYGNEDVNRNKRGFTRTKTERKTLRTPDNEEKGDNTGRKNKDQLKTEHTHKLETVIEENDSRGKRKRIGHTRRHVDKIHNTEKDFKRNTKQHQEPREYDSRPNYEQTKYLPYEQGSGVRQHHESELSAEASAPRLFWEPSTGHVVDRTTGQAYILQPIEIK